nr:signal peptidase I [Salinirubrum litoreum]
MPSPTLGGVVNVLAVVVLIAVVAPFVVYSMPAVVGADHSFVVLSGSMEPEISPGDVVVVSEATQRQIERGDVITFMQRDAEVPTTHRVVEVNPREEGVAYTTKGDANEDPDPAPVRPEQVIGEVTYVIPLIGYVVRFANTQTGFLLLIGLPLGLLVVNEAWSILRAGNDGTGGGETTSDEGGVAAAPEAADAPTAPDATTTPAVTTAESVTGESGTADRTTAESTATDAGDESTEPTASTYTVTRSDLRLSMAILSVFAVYATWIALQETSGVTVTAAVGSGAGVVICGAIYYAAGGDAGSSSSTVAHRDGPDDDDGGAVTDTGPDDGGSAGTRVARSTADPGGEDGSSAADSAGDGSLPTVEPPVVRLPETPETPPATGGEKTAGHGAEATNGTGVADETAESVPASSDDADLSDESGDGGEER